MCGLLVSLLTTIAVAAHELINTSCCIDELSLARVEGVRRVGDLYLDERIGLAISQLPAGIYLLQIGNDWVKVTL